MAALANSIAKLRHVVMMVFTLVALLMSAQVSYAVEPDEILDDPKLEARARSLSHNLRCLVCQNQSIDESDAPLARDLRQLVRERLQKGDSDQDVIDFVVARYGDFVLLTPPLKPTTVLLWLAPLLLLAGGIVLVRRVFQQPADVEIQRDVAISAPLSDQEQARLDQLLNDDDQRSGQS